MSLWLILLVIAVSAISGFLVAAIDDKLKAVKKAVKK